MENEKNICECPICGEPVNKDDESPNGGCHIECDTELNSDDEEENEND